jgi:uncharacterized protein (TIGR03067 family)
VVVALLLALWIDHRDLVAVREHAVQLRQNLEIARLRSALSAKITLPDSVDLLAAEVDPHSSTARQEMQNIQGDWLLVYWRMNAKDLDAAKEKIVLTFTDNEFSVRIGDRLHEAGTFSLNPAASPPAFDHTVTTIEGKPAELRLPGIYLLRDDLLIVCVGYGGDRPKTFSTGAVSSEELVIYRRLIK